MKHVTVLQTEAIEALCLTPHAVVVDATVGSGGHTRAILDILDKSGILIGIDADEQALQEVKTFVAGASARTQFVCRNFRAIDEVLKECSITTVDAILADLGWRIEQFDTVEGTEGKGFSFKANESLLMTYGDPAVYPFTAGDMVNEWEEESIQNVIKGYGEERFSGRIARAIVEARTKSTIRTARELAEIISDVVPGFYRRGPIHPATRTFQALRIAVNDELGALKEFIQKGVGILGSKGRFAIITFHSIEDRIVKHAFRALEKEGKGRVVTKKPIQVSDEERSINPRARSAKLRIFEAL
jgi:16S rRNA (cytosine1402-N4)-methyltransferase